MKKPNRKQREFLGKLIRIDELERKNIRDENYIDLTKPSVLIWITISYIAILFFVIIGVPWMGSDSTPIPPEQLPVAIPIFIFLYVVVIGGFFLRDKLRK